jgi:menaquinone-dependent protoporphyrinogen IX oxidase
MKDVNDPSRYRAIVAGSAFQSGRWLPEAMQFIHTHQSALVSIGSEALRRVFGMYDVGYTCTHHVGALRCAARR